MLVKSKVVSSQAYGAIQVDVFHAEGNWYEVEAESDHMRGFMRLGFYPTPKRALRQGVRKAVRDCPPVGGLREDWKVFVERRKLPA